MKKINRKRLTLKRAHQARPAQLAGRIYVDDIFLQPPDIRKARWMLCNGVVYELSDGDDDPHRHDDAE